MPEYTPPIFKKSEFNCPHCYSYAHQEWSYMTKRDSDSIGYASFFNAKGFMISTCMNCKKISLWLDSGELIFPSLLTAPLPNSDMPEEILDEYNEAREIVNRSPRAAAALIRLSIQKLLPQIGGDGSNINDDIKKLVKSGKIGVDIQKALDSLRVIGNESIHPGVMDMKDDSETAFALFRILNIIIERTISYDKQIDELWDKIPESKKKAVKKRDLA